MASEILGIFYHIPSNWRACFSSYFRQSASEMSHTSTNKKNSNDFLSRIFYAHFFGFCFYFFLLKGLNIRVCCHSESVCLSIIFVRCYSSLVMLYNFTYINKYQFNDWAWVEGIMCFIQPTSTPFKLIIMHKKSWNCECYLNKASLSFPQLSEHWIYTKKSIKHNKFSLQKIGIFAPN